MSSWNVRPGSLKRLNPIDRHKKRRYIKADSCHSRGSLRYIKSASRAYNNLQNNLRTFDGSNRASRNRLTERSSPKEKPFICSQINFHRRLFSARAKPSFTLRIGNTKNRILRFREPTFPSRSRSVKSTEWEEKFIYISHVRRMGGILTRDRVL